MTGLDRRSTRVAGCLRKDHRFLQIEFLTIGHISRDTRPDGTFTPGGTVTFAALTAHRLGLSAGIVTCADSGFSAILPSFLPGIALHVRPSAATTTFTNLYTNGLRTQYLRARGETLQLTDIPTTWHNAPIVLLGPLAQELGPEFVTLFPHHSGSIIAATPQGWLRSWDSDGRIRPTPWLEAEQLLPAFDVLILSYDDLLPTTENSGADEILKRWSMSVPLLVATNGSHGATLFRQGNARHFPAYIAKEVDPTGAGDVFAAAFLTYLYQHTDPEAAMNFANCAASFSIEQEGIHGIPTQETIASRIREAS